MTVARGSRNENELLPDTNQMKRVMRPEGRAFKDFHLSERCRLAPKGPGGAGRGCKRSHITPTEQVKYATQKAKNEGHCEDRLKRV